ncbi:hypothetical protein Tco_0289814 [Tanacetum coccineum]
MNPQEIKQVTARDEKWVPSTKRVKISPTNVRLETTVHQKEETFQVIIDVIKNSMCFKAFTISADGPEIFMQQFWYTIKKILNIFSKVEGEEFTKPWRTLASIINNYLSGKTASNDRLRRSRIDILWGMFYKENVDYHELIWEDIAFQIDHRKEKRSRRETMPFPRFTKVIINHFLSQHKSLFNLKYQQYHTIKDDGIVSKLKFVRIGEDYREYGLPILDMMLNDRIKQSKSYQMFIKYSTGQIPPKKSRVKGSQGKKTAYTAEATVDKVTISAADNIIPDPDVALELGKSISLTKAVKEEAARQVHATHARIVTESFPKPARRRPSGVPDESIVVSATSSEGTGTKPGVLDEEKVTSEANIILEWGSEQECDYSEEDQCNTLKSEYAAEC